MTNKEQKTLDSLFTMMSNFQGELSRLKENTNDHIDEINKKVDKKHLPINLEAQINSQANEAISSSIKSVLTGYNTPLNKIVEIVVNEKFDILKEIISTSFDTVIEAEAFKQSIVEPFSHKVSRSIISNNDGLFDKVSNELKNSPEFKAKMTLAVANVVEECLKNDK